MSAVLPNHSRKTPLPAGWDVKKIRNLVEEKTGKKPCWWQIKTALAIHDGKDVVGVARTGAGKTMSFWIALMMSRAEGCDDIAVVVTPLNLLGKQNAIQLNDGSFLSAIAVSKENSNAQTYKDIASAKYNVVVISPELLNEDLCQTLIKNPKFAAKIMYFVFDEAHCISQWGKTFRDQYLHVGIIRHLLPRTAKTIPFHIASATLPKTILDDVVDLLLLRPKSTEHVTMSNDRPNIDVVVRQMEHPIDTYQDLSFLIPPDFKDGDPPPPKFVVFMDNTRHAEDAVKALRELLPSCHHDKIRYFHATMTSMYRDENLEAFQKGEVWGLVVTDAFGMGIDLPDIQIVVQYRATCDFNTLWQRFGRAGRGPDSSAIAVFLVEKTFFDADRLRKQDNRTKKTKAATSTETKENTGPFSSSKRKAKAQGGSPPKRRRVHNASNLEIPSPDQAADLTPSTMPTVPASVGDYAQTDESRRLMYQAKLATGARTRRSKGKQDEPIPIGSALDEFINAPTRGISCRRHVVTLYYSNDRVNNNYHLLCDEHNPAGCARCRPKRPERCCDLCSPNAFSEIPAVSLACSTRGTGKIRVSKYEPNEAHATLRSALEEWRLQVVPQALGSLFSQWGTQLFLSNQMLDRIVDCAASKKLTSLSALRIEIQWRAEYLREYGQKILDIVEKHFPSTVVPATKSQETCSGCGQKGHRKNNKRCPARLQVNVPSTPSGSRLPLTPLHATPFSGTSTPSRLPLTPLHATLLCSEPVTATPSNLDTLNRHNP
ncbi:hypothetical protein D9758_015559 [Tetrapyrgos nigripes]|uniref:DNA 3'-5' helicase n=1 Tax=Tetrapyrgos nigripes TaxID=182062 RepID=A0A8H5FJP2_9AGAR|nr:hypothetical protein D9758_015559 [Tetrapyrgos nigripes]